MNAVVDYVLFQCSKQRPAFAVRGSDVFAAPAALDLCQGLTPDECSELVCVLQKEAYGQSREYHDMPTVERWSAKAESKAELKSRRGYRLLQPQPWLWQIDTRTIRSLQRVAPAVRGVPLIPVAGCIEAWEQDAIAAQRKLLAEASSTWDDPQK